MTLGKQSKSLEISETFWGYIVREPQDRFDKETLTESVLRFFGLVFVLLAYGQWLLPGSLFSGDVLAIKMVFSFLFAATGTGLYMFAGRGFRHEVQVDPSRREVRFAMRNARNQSRLKSRLPMEGVASAFVMRSKSDPNNATLFFRLHGVSAPLQVITGRPTEIERLHQRLCHDLSPREERLERGLRAGAGVAMGAA